MKNYLSTRTAGFLFLILGLMGMLLGLISLSENSILSPVFLVLGVLFVLTDTCKSKEYCNKNLYMAIVVASIAVMLFWEYIFAPAQNRLIFYLIAAILAITFFVMSYSMLTPEKSRTGKEKKLSWIITFLFGFSLFGLMAIVYNDFVTALALGVFVVIMFVISRLIHRRRTIKA